MEFDYEIICSLAWLKPDWMPDWVAWLVPLILFFAQYPQCLALVLGDKVKASIHDFSRLEVGPPRLSGRDLAAAERLRAQRQSLHSIAIAESWLAWIWRQRSWSAVGFGRALQIALWYPIALLLVLWLVSGSAVSIGDWAVMKRVDAAGQRLLSIGALAGAVLAYLSLQYGWIPPRILSRFWQPEGVRLSRLIARIDSALVFCITLAVMLFFLLSFFNLGRNR